MNQLPTDINQAVAIAIAMGWQLQYVAPDNKSAVLHSAPAQGTNHILHLLLAILTLGLWIPIWFLLAVTTPPKGTVRTLTLYSDSPGVPIRQVIS